MRYSILDMFNLRYNYTIECNGLKVDFATFNIAMKKSLTKLFIFFCFIQQLKLHFFHQRTKEVALAEYTIYYKQQIQQVFQIVFLYFCWYCIAIQYKCVICTKCWRNSFKNKKIFVSLIQSTCTWWQDSIKEGLVVAEVISHRSLSREEQPKPLLLKREHFEVFG